MKVHHIGYLVKSIKAALKEFESLGYLVEKDIFFDEIRSIYICFIQNDHFRVELVEPANTNSVVFNLMKRYKNSPYHLCYESEDFKGDIEMLTRKGYVVFQDIQIAPAIANKRVIFLMNYDIGIIELVEACDERGV